MNTSVRMHRNLGSCIADHGIILGFIVHFQGQQAVIVFQKDLGSADMTFHHKHEFEHFEWKDGVSQAQLRLDGIEGDSPMLEAGPCSDNGKSESTKN